MSDVMHPVEIKGHLVLLGQVMRVLKNLPLDEMAQAFEHYDSVGLFFDPTGWRDTQDNRRQNAEIIRAAMPLWTKAREVFAAMPEEEEGVR